MNFGKATKIPASGMLSFETLRQNNSIRQRPGAHPGNKGKKAQACYKYKQF